MESNLRFHQLITVDRPEAVGTLEAAINAKLNAFHNLYDLMLQELENPINWYDIPQLCIILAIRNARHHNKANRIRSIYNYHSQTCDPPTEERTYMYVNFPSHPDEEGGRFFDVPLSWADLDLFLSFPRRESRLRPEARGLIRDYIDADGFEAESARAGVSKEHIFFNFVPLALNAGISLHPHIQDYVTPASVESQSFLNLFGSTGQAVTDHHECQTLQFLLPM